MSPRNIAFLPLFLNPMKNMYIYVCFSVILNKLEKKILKLLSAIFYVVSGSGQQESFTNMIADRYISNFLQIVKFLFEPINAWQF